MPEAFFRQRLLLIWALAATFVALAFAASALWLLLRNRQLTAMLDRSRATEIASPVAPSASPFPGLRDSDVPGRYRWFHAGLDTGTIELKADHTFVNKDGKTLPKYRWELAHDGLIIVWQSGQVSRFPVMERPGVFLFPRSNGEDTRLEKIEETKP
jgi:hypothetical protein